MTRFEAPDFVKRLDIFSGAVPSFNIGGKTSVPTSAGAMCSIVIFLLTFAFGLLKMQDLLSRKNPIIVSNSEVIEEGETYSLGSPEFMMAFALHKFNGEILDFDPRYVRWIVRTWEDRDGIRSETFVPLHICEEEEMKRFFQAESETT